MRAMALVFGSAGPSVVSMILCARSKRPCATSARPRARYAMPRLERSIATWVRVRVRVRARVRVRVRGTGG